MGTQQVLPFQMKVNLGVMVIKGYSTFPTDGLETIQDIYWGEGVLLLWRVAVGVFYSPSRLGDNFRDTLQQVQRKVRRVSIPAWASCVCNKNETVYHHHVSRGVVVIVVGNGRRHEFKSWTRLIAFHIALIPLGKGWIQLFSLQLWVNSRTD